MAVPGLSGQKGCQVASGGSRCRERREENKIIYLLYHNYNLSMTCKHAREFSIYYIKHCLCLKGNNSTEVIKHCKAIAILHLLMLMRWVWNEEKAFGTILSSSSTHNNRELINIKHICFAMQYTQ